MNNTTTNTHWDCLVIGAGIAGLLAARQVQEAGHKVLVLDKSRGVGGRMATRRIDNAVFDHGAQYFTARDPRFQAMLTEWEAAGAVRAWFQAPPSEANDDACRYIGSEGMTSLPKYLAKDLSLNRNTAIRKAKADDTGWKLYSEDDAIFSGTSLVVTAPIPQGREILSPVAEHLPPDFLQQLGKVRYTPCFSLMLMLDGPSGIEAPGFVHAPAPGLACMSDNAIKGISDDAVAVTVLATPAFSSTYFDEEPDVVAEKIYDAISDRLESPVRSWQLQRWRYSKVLSWLYEPCLLSTTPHPIAYAGDAFIAPRIEGAALSGVAAGQAIVQLLDTT